jgi:uncharacterized protein (DUF58 family)
MLDYRWLTALLTLGVWATWHSHELLAQCAALGLMVSLTLVVGRRFALSGVSYRRRLGAEQTQFGDVVELSIEFENLKLLPLAALHVEDQLPRHLKIEGGTVLPGRIDGLPQLCIARAMLPYERVIRRLQIRCTRRGRHRFGPARWETEDHLGWRSTHRTGAETQQLLVLPKLFALAMGRSVADQLSGRTAAQRQLITDPLRTLGARDYVPGDPMRLVDWRATARRGALMVRQLEPSTTPTVQLVLDFRVRDPRGDRYEPDELEFAISVAASLSAYGTARKWRLGLTANGLSDGVPIVVPPSSAPAQLEAVLSVLARASSTPSGPLSSVLSPRRAQHLERRAVLVITHDLDEEAAEVLQTMHGRGHSVAVIFLGPAERELDLGSITTLRAPYDEAWAERDELVLSA